MSPKIIELLEELFAIGGNHDAMRTFEIRNKFLELLREEHHLLALEDNEDAVLAKDAIYFIDAHHIYATTTDRTEAYLRIQPIFERLMQADGWNYYEIKFVITSLSFTISLEQAIELGTKAVQRLLNFKVANDADYIEGVLACNMCSRILYAKYFDADVKLNLVEDFSLWLSKLKRLTEKESKLEVGLLATEIREAILNKNQEQIFKLLDKLESKYDKNVANTISNEINSYLVSKKYNPLLHKGIFAS